MSIGKIDDDVFNNVKILMKIRYENAVRWRDGSVLYFQTFSELPIPEELEKPEHDLKYYIINNPR